MNVGVQQAEPLRSCHFVLSGCNESGFARAAHDAHFAFHYFSDGVAGRPEVFARVKFSRIFGENLADLAGEGDAQVGVNIDFADAGFGGLGDHVFGYAARTGQIATVFIADSGQIFGN